MSARARELEGAEGLALRGQGDEEKVERAGDRVKLRLVRVGHKSVRTERHRLLLL